MATVIEFKKKEKTEVEKTIEQQTNDDLALLSKKNEENKKRIEKERLDNNKKVLRSYRIKN